MDSPEVAGPQRSWWRVAGAWVGERTAFAIFTCVTLAVAAVVMQKVGAPDVTGLPRALLTALHVQRAKAAPGTVFTVMVADLGGTNGDEFAQQLVDILGRTRGIAAQRHRRVLELPGLEEYSQEVENADRTGLGWLTAKNADLLIWGRVVGNRLQLRFLTRNGSRTDLSSYRPPTELTLDTAFQTSLGNMLVAVAISEAAGQLQRETPGLLELQRHVAGRLDSLSRGTALVTADQRTEVRGQYARMLSDYGDRIGDTASLRTAINAYNEAIRTAPPHGRARFFLQSDMAFALLRLGTFEAEPRSLTEAIAAYRRALFDYPGATDLQRRTARLGVGTALIVRGTRVSDMAELKEGISIFEGVWSECLAIACPQRLRATTLANLGGALTTLGEHESNATLALHAVDICRGATFAIDHGRSPLDWALAQRNLGIALLILGKAQEDTMRLKEAKLAFEKALTEETRERVPVAWAQTQSALGSALFALATKQRDFLRLEDAISAFRHALSLSKGQHDFPNEWRVRIEMTLASALVISGEGEASKPAVILQLVSLGARATDAALLQEAAAIYRRVSTANGGSERFSSYSAEASGRLREVERLLSQTRLATP